LSAIMTAVSDNTPYYMAMTADPAKNDISEIQSQLNKLYPDGRYGDEQAWHKRYGLNTTASRDALQREVGSRFFTQEITPPVKMRPAERAVTLHPWQQAEYERVMQHFNKARAAMARGEVAVDAIKALRPEKFEGVPEAQHEAIARQLQRGLPTMKDNLLNRVVNLAPADKNAKVQSVLSFLKDHPVKEKPVVIFAGNYASVDMLHDALAKAGHRVAVLDGRKTTKEKDLARRQFQPDKGKEPEAEIFILSNAGATGLNLQRGQTLINYDTPLTAMVHNQRKGRIFRLGQTRDVDVVDLVSNTEFEQRARERLHRKYDLRKIFVDPGESMDDTGLAAAIARARARAHAAQQALADSTDATLAA
jgi:SNF2 family DNA or RNA helicase